MLYPSSQMLFKNFSSIALTFGRLPRQSCNVSADSLEYVSQSSSSASKTFKSLSKCSKKHICRKNYLIRFIRLSFPILINNLSSLNMSVEDLDMKTEMKLWEPEKVRKISLCECDWRRWRERRLRSKVKGRKKCFWTITSFLMEAFHLTASWRSTIPSSREK